MLGLLVCALSVFLAYFFEDRKRRPGQWFLSDLLKLSFVAGAVLLALVSLCTGAWIQFPLAEAAGGILLVLMAALTIGGYVHGGGGLLRHALRTPPVYRRVRSGPSAGFSAKV